MVSGVEGGKTYYRKQFVSPDRTAELVITYPKSRASVYDPWVTEIEKSFVAYRASDTAQASSSTEPPSVVTRRPRSTPRANCRRCLRRPPLLWPPLRSSSLRRRPCKTIGWPARLSADREQRRGRAGRRCIARPAARRRAYASSAFSAQSRHRYSARRTRGYCAGGNRQQPGGCPKSTESRRSSRLPKPNLPLGSIRAKQQSNSPTCWRTKKQRSNIQGISMRSSSSCVHRSKFRTMTLLRSCRT